MSLHSEAHGEGAGMAACLFVCFTEKPDTLRLEAGGTFGHEALREEATVFGDKGSDRGTEVSTKQGKAWWKSAAMECAAG